jgi:hypothetical protein
MEESVEYLILSCFPGEFFLLIRNSQRVACRIVQRELTLLTSNYKID